MIIKRHAIPVSAFLLSVVLFACDHRKLNDQIYRHPTHGYTIAIPDGWSIEEERDGDLRIEAPGMKDENDQSPTIYIIVVDRPDDWSYEKDTDDLSRHFTNYSFREKGIEERKGVSYYWISFDCDELESRHANFNCVIPTETKVITLGCFAAKNYFPQLKESFRECAFSIEPAGTSHDY